MMGIHDMPSVSEVKGAWVESDVDTYWRSLHPNLDAEVNPDAAVYATNTRPGDIIMTSWCDRTTGIPTVGAVDLWRGDEKQPSEFYRFAPAPVSVAPETDTDGER